MEFPRLGKLRRVALVVTFILGGTSSLHAEGLGLFGKRQHDCRPYVCPLPTPAAPVTEPTRPPDTKLPDTKLPDKQAPEQVVEAPMLDATTSAALGGAQVAIGATAGYIDNALPFTHFRVRYDAAWNANFPDRAEFLYAKCGCFKVAGIDPNAPGPPRPEKRIDFQNLTAYLELANNGRYSVFVEGVYKWLNPVENANASDFGDMNAGFKLALYSSETSIYTFQLRGYFPTGDAFRGLGTDHVSLEPSLLYSANPTCRWNIFGQVGVWLPIGGTDFAGNVMMYGVGTSYIIYDTCSWRVAPVVEMLGWTVLDGQQSSFFLPGAVSASGDTIINVKMGLRFGFGPGPQFGVLGNSDLYVGYGRSLTGDVWYEDIARVEYRIRF